MPTYVAASPHDGMMDSLVLPQVNAQAMSLFLGEVSSRHPDEFILMVMDGAGWPRLWPNQAASDRLFSN